MTKKWSVRLLSLSGIVRVTWYTIRCQQVRRNQLALQQDISLIETSINGAKDATRAGYPQAGRTKWHVWPVVCWSSSGQLPSLFVDTNSQSIESSTVLVFCCRVYYLSVIYKFNGFRVIFLTSVGIVTSCFKSKCSMIAPLMTNTVSVTSNHCVHLILNCFIDLVKIN